MSVDLVKLLIKFNNINDFEFEGRIFKTNVKSVAPKAYLNIIYKAASEEIREELMLRLRVPDTLKDFYSKYNGANFFIDGFDIYGFLPENYLIDRSDWRKRLPFNIVENNKEYSCELESRDLLCIGSYAYDRSNVCIERKTGKVFCFLGDDFNKIRATWKSFEEWITKEIERLSGYHDENGNLLVSLEKTIPGM